MTPAGRAATTLVPLGDRAIRAERPSGVAGAALFERLRALPGVLDVVITENHVAVYGTVAREAVADALAAFVPSTDEIAASVLHVVRVRYDGEDLAAVAAQCGISVDDVVSKHTAREYRVKMIGFLPGFAYLGPLDAALVVPRRETPRVRVPAGSVAIAAEYTGIYPFESPGGWSLLGHAVGFSPFDPVNGARLSLGDRVRFEAAS